jgi:hypothetical protein
LNNKPKRISTIFFSSYYLSPGTSGPYWTHSRKSLLILDILRMRFDLQFQCNALLQGVEEDIWTKEGWTDRRLEKTA